MTGLPEIDPDKWLRRRETAKALQACGFPVAEKSLATHATRGGGPPFKRFGRIPLYRWGDSLGWANTKLTSSSSNSKAVA
jgi:hypothetical protein